MIPTPPSKSNLRPWCVIRHLPNMQRLVLARFNNESDADGYLRVIRRLMPQTSHVIIYDPPQVSDRPPHQP